MRHQIHFNDVQEANLYSLMSKTSLNNKSETVHFALSLANNYIDFITTQLFNSSFKMYFMKEGYHKKAKLKQKRGPKTKFYHH